MECEWRGSSSERAKERASARPAADATRKPPAPLRLLETKKKAAKKLQGLCVCLNVCARVSLCSKPDSVVSLTRSKTWGAQGRIIEVAGGEERRTDAPTRAVALSRRTNKNTLSLIYAVAATGSALPSPAACSSAAAIPPRLGSLAISLRSPNTLSRRDVVGQNLAALTQGAGNAATSRV